MEGLPLEKADNLKRFVAIMIDLFIAFLLGLIPRVGWIAGMLYLIFRDGLHWKYMEHRSLGKAVMNLKVVAWGKENKRTDLLVSFKRNFFFIIPILSFIAVIIEGIKVLASEERQRYGDLLAKTAVVSDDFPEEPASGAEL